MAKMIEYNGLEEVDGKLVYLGREAIRRVVMAGAEACVRETQQNVEGYHHIVTGNMLQSVAPGRYHEDLGSGWVDVYPQGDDARGVSNAKKAFVINYGYGGHKTARTGDKFITGKKNQMSEAVSAAMQRESDRIIQEMNGG